MVNTGAPTDPVSRLIFREVPKVARTAFLSYLANTILAIIITNSFVLFLGSTIPPLNDFFDALGFIASAYAGIVYLLTRRSPSKWLGTQFYLLAILGLALGGFLYAIAAYQLLSAGYWLRQAWTGNGCKCTRDGGDVVALGNAFLACRKCSRKVSISYDIPKPWNNTAAIALIVGIAIIVVGYVFPIFPGGTLIFYVGNLLAYNGGIFTFSRFGFRSFSGYVRFPPNTPITDDKTSVGKP